MKRAMLFLAVLGLAGSLYGADPIIGKWKLNVAKLISSPTIRALRKQAPVKEKMSICRELDTGQIECTDKGVLTDGSLTSEIVMWPKQGGMGKLQPPPPEGLSYVETLIKSGEWYVTVMRNGNQVALMKKVISKDGKTMQVTITGIDPQGKSIEEIQVWERQ